MSFLFFAEDPGTIEILFPIFVRFKLKNKSINFLTSSYANINKFEKNSFTIINKDQDLSKYLIKTKIVVIGSSENVNTIGKKIISTCKKKNILCIGIVDRCLLIEKRYDFNVTNSNYDFPDWILTPEKKAIKKLMELGLRKDRIKYFYKPIIDKYRDKRGLLKKGFIKSKKEKKSYHKTWLFLAESKSLLCPKLSIRDSEYIFKGSGEFLFRDAIILEELLFLRDEIDPKIRIILRLHPKNLHDDFKGLIEKVDLISQHENPLEVFQKADVVFGITTNLLLTSCLLNKPTISVLPKLSEIEFLPEEIVHKIKIINNKKQLNKSIFTKENMEILQNKVWKRNGDDVYHILEKFNDEL